MYVMHMQAALQHGIDTLSQAEVGSALQVYFNLGILKQVNTNIVLCISADSWKDDEHNGSNPTPC